MAFDDFVRRLIADAIGGDGGSDGAAPPPPPPPPRQLSPAEQYLLPQLNPFAGNTPMSAQRAATFPTPPPPSVPAPPPALPPELEALNQLGQIAQAEAEAKANAGVVTNPTAQMAQGIEDVYGGPVDLPAAAAAAAQGVGGVVSPAASALWDVGQQVPYLSQGADLVPQALKLGPLSAELVRNPNWQNAIDLLGQGARGSNQAVWSLNPLNVAGRAVGADVSPAAAIDALLGSPKSVVGALRNPKKTGLGALEKFNESPYGQAINWQGNQVLDALGDTVYYGLTGQGDRPLGFLPGNIDTSLAALWWAGNLALADDDGITPQEAINQTLAAHDEGGGQGAAVATMGLSGKGRPGALGFLSTIIQQTLADPVTWETAGAGAAEGWLTSAARDTLAKSRITNYALENMSEAERAANFGSKGIKGLSGDELAQWDGMATEAGYQPSAAAAARAQAAQGVAELIGSGKALAEAPEKALSTATRAGWTAATQIPGIGPLLEHLAAPAARTVSEEIARGRKSVMGATKRLGGPIDARRAQQQAAEDALIAQGVGLARDQVGDYGNDAVRRYTVDGNDLVVVLNDNTRRTVQPGMGTGPAKRAATQLNDELVASRMPVAPEEVVPTAPPAAAPPTPPEPVTVTGQDAMGRPVTQEVPIPTAPIPGGGVPEVNGDRFFPQDRGTVVPEPGVGLRRRGPAPGTRPARPVDQVQAEIAAAQAAKDAAWAADDAAGVIAHDQTIQGLQTELRYRQLFPDEATTATYPVPPARTATVDRSVPPPRPTVTVDDLTNDIAAHRSATPNWEQTIDHYQVMKGNVIGVKRYGERNARPLIVEGRTVQAPNPVTAARVVKQENAFLADLQRETGGRPVGAAAGGAPVEAMGIATRENPLGDYAAPPAREAPGDLRTQEQIVAEENAAIEEAANEARLRRMQEAQTQAPGTVLAPEDAEILGDLRGMRNEAEATVGALEAEPSAAQSRELYDARVRLGEIQNRISQLLTGEGLPPETRVNPPRGPLPAEAEVRAPGEVPPAPEAPGFPSIAELRAQARSDAVARAREGYVPPQELEGGVQPTPEDPTADFAAFGEATPPEPSPIPEPPPLAARMAEPLEQARSEVANRSAEDFQAIAQIEPLNGQLVVVDTAGNRQVLDLPAVDDEVAAAIAAELTDWVHGQHAPISPPGVGPVPQVGPVRGTATAATAPQPSFAAEGEPVMPGEQLGYMHPKPGGKRAVDAVPELGRDQPNAAQRFWERYSPLAKARDAQQKAIESGANLTPAAKAVENAVAHQEHMVNDFAAAYRDEFGADPPITIGASRKQIEKQSVNNLLELMLWDPNEAHRRRAFDELKRRAEPVRPKGKKPLKDQPAIAERMDRIRALYQTENTRRLNEEAIAGRSGVPGESAQFSTNPDLNERYSEDELQWAVEHHVLSQEQADGLQEVVTVKYTDNAGKEVITEERLIDAKQRHKDEGMSDREAENAVIEEIYAAVPKEKRARMGFLERQWRRRLRAESRLTRFIKDKNLYGYRKVLPGTFWDVTEGVLRRGMNGQFDSIAAATSPKNIRAGFRATKENASEYFDETPDGKELARYGADQPAYTHGGGRAGETGAPVLQQWIGKKLEGRPGQRLAKFAAGYFGSENGQALRNTMDGVFRFTDFSAGFRKQIAQGKVKFFREVGAAATREGIAPSELRTFRRSLGDAFSAWEVEDLAKQTGFSDGVAQRLASEWQGHLNDAAKAGRARMNAVSFDMGARNADEYARKLWLYHFWMSRASPYYLRSALRNPALFRFYNNFLTDMANACEEQGGQKCGYLQIAKVAGMSTLVPGGFLLSTALLNLEPDQANKPDASMFDKIFNNPNVPLQLKPFLQAEAFVVGLTQKHADLVGMNADVGDLTSAWNLAASQGWIDQKALRPNAMRKFQNAFFDNARALVDKLEPGEHPVPHIDETAGDKRAISQLLVSNVAEAHGIGPAEDVTTWVAKYPAAWKELKNAELDFASGSDKNQIVNDAIADYYAGGAVRQATAWAIPGIIQESSQGVLDRQAIKANVPEEGSFAARGAKSQLPELGSPEDVRLWAQQTEQRALSTNPETGGNTKYGLADDIFNEIVYSDTPVPRVTGGDSYSSQDIAAMSYDERKLLAQRVLTEAGLADEWAQLDADEKLFRALPGNEEIAAYQQWKGSWLGAEGGVPAMREQAVAGNPSYAAYIEQLPDEIKDDPERLDQASTSPDAYLALHGKKSSTFDEELPTRDESNIPYDPAATGGDGTGAPSGSFSQLSKGEQVARDQAKWEIAKAQARGYLYQFTGDPDFVLENTNPQLRQALENRLRSYGISPPSMPASVRRYETWKLGKKPGEDTSLAAYTLESAQMDAILAPKGYDFDFMLDVLASQNGLGLDPAQVLPSMPAEYGAAPSPGVGNLLGQRYAATVDQLLGGDGRRSAGVNQLLGGSGRYSPSVGDYLGGNRYSDRVDELLGRRSR